MKRLKHAWPLALAALTLTFGGCKKDSPEEEDEQELITTVTLSFTELGTTNTRTATFRDTDGPGGNAPTLFETVTLQPNKQYSCSLLLLNEAASPVQDITGEIRTEGDEHQFYFTPSAGNTITVSNLDTDAGGLPLGLASRWTTAAAGTGTLKLTLKHKPGIKASNDPITKGDTDIELDFPTRVQ